MTSSTTQTHRPTDAEIEAAILGTITELASDDGDLVAWRRVRALLPRCGFWQAHEALDRLERKVEVVLVQVRGVPFVGLADEATRMAERARVDRGEPRQPVAV